MLDKVVKITPEELYFLGSMMNAKYIDYAYIAALDDISENYALKEAESIASVSNKGILDEDFSGVSIKSEMLQLFKPIFFGESELVVDFYDFVSEKASVNISRFHLLDGNITRVVEEENVFSVESTTSEMLWNSIEKILKNRDGEPIESAIKISDTFNPDKMLVLKYAEVGEESISLSFIFVDGYVYVLTKEDEIDFVDNDKLNEIISSMKEW